MKPSLRPILWILFPLLVGIPVLLLVGVLAGWGGGGRGDERSVILYCAQDQPFAEAVVRSFTERTGIPVRAVYDSEAVKTVGLANRLAAEKGSPRADVFWGNEELRTRQLEALGVFGTNQLQPGGPGWVAFGQRTRRLVVHSTRVSPENRPASLIELTNARWRGRVSLALPHFGTTSTHFHALRAAWGEAAWKAWCGALVLNQPFLEEGNSHVVRRIARGEALVGLTDSDDIEVARREGAPVVALPVEEDMIAIANTLALVRPAGPDAPARLLVEHLLSPEVRRLLVGSGGLETAEADPGNRRMPDWAVLLRELEVGGRQLEEMFRR
jgi:iron(III) transport system substrate-binding protein